MSHPYLANLPPPSPTTHTTLEPLEFSSPQTPRQRLSKKGWQKNSSQSHGGVIQQDGPWAWHQRTQMPALALLGSHCATLGKLLINKLLLALLRNIKEPFVRKIR